MKQNYRLYSFVANHYLSPLQCGLQTAHVVGELMTAYKPDFNEVGDAVYEWAQCDKTIIIMAAGNHEGVLNGFQEIRRTSVAIGLPYALFREDERSMNGMATAFGVIVPQKYWDTKFSPEVVYSSEVIGQRPRVSEAYWSYTDTEGITTKYQLTHPEGQFVDSIKSYRLA